MPITTPPTIDPTPSPAPVRSERSTFSGRVDAFVTWLGTGVMQFNNVASNCYNNAIEAYNNAVSAATQAATAAAQAGISTTQAGISAAKAAEAAASAQTALNAPGTSATSATTETFGAGSKTLTIQTGKLFVPGMHVIAAKTSDPAKYMRGIVTSYDSGTGVLAFTSDNKYTGSGSNGAWTISLSGSPGADGASGLDYLASAGALTAGMQYCLNSSGASFTAVMPPSPGVGDLVAVSDPFLSWATNPVTLDRNGSNFVDQYGTAQAEDFELNVAGVSVIFIYTASGWRAI